MRGPGAGIAHGAVAQVREGILVAADGLGLTCGVPGLLVVAEDGFEPMWGEAEVLAAGEGGFLPRTEGVALAQGGVQAVGDALHPQA